MNLKAPTPTFTVALLGNPNSGKSTLFNALTGARQRVGNFAGVTVARKEGSFVHGGRLFQVVDLPGIYSLSAHSLEERVARDYLLTEKPDLVVNVVDAGNLERNLFLSVQLAEMGLPLVYCLNMADEARAKGLPLDVQRLPPLLGAPAVETVGRTGDGIPNLKEILLQQATAPQVKPSPLRIGYDDHLEAAIACLTNQLSALPQGERRAQAVSLLEGGGTGGTKATVALAEEQREEITRLHGDPPQVLLAMGRYGHIHGLLKQAGLDGHSAFGWTRRLDGLFLHRQLGLPLFFLAVWVMFEATFTLGSYPTQWIDWAMSGLSSGVSRLLPEGLLRALLVDGILNGVGGVVVFLPNIILLFLFISFFEDTGYMARAAFLMDRFMRAAGLHGKAFIPLLMGFGCNVPAIMATRAMEHPRDRLVTILINPFMSCSARLPVFVLFSGAFFPDHAALALFAIHLVGVLVALSTAFFFRNSVLKGPAEPFVMELPPYRLPTLRAILTHMWERASEFLKKVGGVILAGAVVIWFLQAFPQPVQVQPGQAPTPTYLEQVGQAIAPVFAPLGIDWRGSVALLSGFVAKEVVVSTLAVLHQAGGSDDPSLSQSLRQAMTPLTAACFMIFTLLYTPCLATIAVIRREAGSWGWAGFSVAFSLCIAWGLAFVVRGIAGIWS